MTFGELMFATAVALGVFIICVVAQPPLPVAAGCGALIGLCVGRLAAHYRHRNRR